MKPSDIWQSLFQRISTEKEGDRFCPTDQDVSAFEDEWKTCLPTSYKSFIQVFGPGTLAQEFKFYAPGSGDSTWDLSHLNDHYQKAIRRLRGNPDAVARPDFLLQMIWFASTFHGTIFGWNPSEVTDAKGCEYEIYMMDRSDPDARPISSSFEEFVNQICLGDQYDLKYRPGAKRALAGPRDEFTPGRIKKPRKRKRS